MALRQSALTAVRGGDPWAEMADVIIILVGVIFDRQDALRGPALRFGRPEVSVGHHGDVVVHFVRGDAPHVEAHVVLFARESELVDALVVGQAKLSKGRWREETKG